MTEPLKWRKSAFSSNQGNCVEIAADGPTVLVRNSNRPAAGVLSLPRPAVAAFVAACRAGELDDLTA